MGVTNNKATKINLQLLQKAWSWSGVLGVKSDLIITEANIYSGTPVLLWKRVQTKTLLMTIWKSVIRPQSFGTSHHPDIFQIQRQPLRQFAAIESVGVLQPLRHPLLAGPPDFHRPLLGQQQPAETGAIGLV